MYNVFPPPPVNQFRLSLESGQPLSTSDQSAKTTLYATPFGGNWLSFYNGSTWIPRQSAEFSLALSGLTPFRGYDVFAYDNAGTPTLETLGWTAPSSGSITAASNATPIVITSTAHGLSTNQLVYISGVGGNTAANSSTGIPFRVTNLTANTFSLQNLAGTNVAGSGAYTSGGTWFRADQQTARATSITLQNGIYVKNGDTTRRYMGSFLATSATTTDDTTKRRFLYNVDNQKRRGLRANSTTSNSYSGFERIWNNDYGNRVEFFLGLATQELAYIRGEQQPGSTTSYCVVGCGFNTVAVYTALFFVNGDASPNSGVDADQGTYSVGYNYLAALQSTAGGTAGTFVSFALNSSMMG